MNPQTVQELPPPLDASELNQQLSPVEVAHIGSAIAHSEVVVSGVDQEYLNKGTQALEAQANGQDIRPEDAGRMHDVEQAYEAALKENEVFNAHVEALRDNEIFDAQVEAEQEDKARTEAQENMKAALAEPETPADQKPAAEQAIDPMADERTQAQMILQNAGYQEQIAASSQVRRDYETGNLIVVEGNTVKILDSRSNKPNVTEYSYDDRENVLTIASTGLGVTKAYVGEYIPSKLGETTSSAIDLPPDVAKLVGSETATPVAPVKGDA
ncbi:MAG TPA: hypothetical protein VLA92_03955 [Candidatus Saccharimonadales bacterium]|nr:hypothetical protein [Candidatus Saccharimonadales bacterium]